MGDAYIRLLRFFATLRMTEEWNDGERTSFYAIILCVYKVDNSFLRCGKERLFVDKYPFLDTFTGKNVGILSTFSFSYALIHEFLVHFFVYR